MAVGLGGVWVCLEGGRVGAVGVRGGDWVGPVSAGSNRTGLSKSAAEGRRRDFCRLPPSKPVSGMAVTGSGPVVTWAKPCFARNVAMWGSGLSWMGRSMHGVCFAMVVTPRCDREGIRGWGRVSEVSRNLQKNTADCVGAGVGGFDVVVKIAWEGVQNFCRRRGWAAAGGRGR